MKFDRERVKEVLSDKWYRIFQGKITIAVLIALLPTIFWLMTFMSLMALLNEIQTLSSSMQIIGIMIWAILAINMAKVLVIVTKWWNELVDFLEETQND